MTTIDRCILTQSSIPRRWRRRASGPALRRRRARGGAGIDDDAVIQHIGVVGDLQTHPRVLFHQQHRHALGLHLLHDAKHLAHDQRRQALRWLVENQEFRIEQQGAGDRQHLLFAAGQLPAAIVLAFLEAGKQLIDPRDGPRSAAFERNLEIFLDAEIGEDAPALRHETDACRGDPEGRPARGVLSEYRDLAFARRGQAHQAAQRRAFAGAVASQQGGDLAFLHFKADAMQDVALAVIGVKAFGGQGCGHAAVPR